MAEKKIKTRIQLKHDAAVNFDRASGFIPMEGEAIIYDKDENHSGARLKIGDGERSVSDLPFLLPAERGSGKDALIVGEGIASGNYSIAGGTTDKSIIENSLGSLVSNKITLETPEASGDSSFAFGGSAKAKSVGSIALGTLNESGVMGLYYSSIDVGNKQITLSLDRSKKSGTNLASSYGWEVGDTISFVNGTPYVAYTTITDISGNVITVDKLPSTIQTHESSKAALGAYLPDDFSICAFYKKQVALVELPFVGTLAENYRWYPRPGEYVFGWASTTIGIENLASGSTSLVSGWNNWGAGDFSSVSGRDNIAGYASHAEGQDNAATGLRSHAEGYQTTASSEHSHAEGKGTTASGVNSHAEGQDTQATNTDAHAEGRKSVASGDGSHAEGLSTQAKGIAAHAAGRECIAEGDRSYAGGWHTHSQQANAFAHGFGLITDSTNSQAVFGQFNEKKPGAAFIVGNGDGGIVDGKLVVTSRSNAMEVDTSGNATFAGTITSGGKPVATEEFVTSKNYLTTIPDEFITETKLNSKGYLTEVPSEYITETELTNKNYATREFVKASYVTAGQKSGVDIGMMATAEGINNEALGAQSHTEGLNCKTSKSYAHAEGTNTIVEGTAAHGEGGYNNILEGAHYAHVEGFRNTVSGGGAHAEGYSSYSVPEEVLKLTHNVSIYDAWAGTTNKFSWAKGEGSHVEGKSCIALGSGSHAEGLYSCAQGSQAHAEGRETYARGDNSHTEGYSTVADNYAHAEGYNTTAYGTGAHAEGGDTTATGNYSHVEGYGCTTVLSYGHAEGSNCHAYSEAAHAEGANSTATGANSHAEGGNTQTNGGNAHSEGGYTQANAWNAHAEGYYTVAKGEHSHSEGWYADLKDGTNPDGTTKWKKDPTTASGKGSHAEGCGAKSEGEGSHAEGYRTNAKGKYSHSQGQDTKAYGQSSHAEGAATQTGELNSDGTIKADSGQYAHAEGYYSKALGKYSHAGGEYTVAKEQAQTAIGKYNKDNANALLIVGNGTGTANSQRSNAFVVEKSGDVTASKNIYANNGQLVATQSWATNWVSTNFAKKTDLTDLDGMPSVDKDGNALNEDTEYIAKYMKVDGVAKWVAVPLSVYNGEVV